MKKLINIVKKNKNIIFKYEDNTEKKYAVESSPIDGIEQETIQVESNKYFIVNSVEFKRRIDSGVLSYCIFLDDINKTAVTLEHNMNFTSSIFVKKVNFSANTFKDNIDFGNSIFLDEVDFINCKFHKQANFHTSTFIKSVSFLKAEFYDGASFKDATFHNKANFSEITSENNEFCFASAKVEYELSFNYAKITRLNINDLNKDNMNLDNFDLNLRMSDIEYIYTIDAIIPKASNRDTFLILKNQALKNNDQISALDFYIKEMNTYKKEAEGFDNVILWFEWGSSYFGTKAYLPIFWIIGINFIFVFSFFYINCTDVIKICHDNFITHFTYSFNPTKSIEDIYSIKNLGWWELINLIKNLIVGALIYETIKSFRKFSRKL